jgi:hypothetical protein
MINTTTIRLETGKVDENDTPSCARSGSYEILIMNAERVHEGEEGEEDDDVDLYADEIDELVECSYLHMLKCLVRSQNNEWNLKVNNNTSIEEKEELMSDQNSLINKNLSMGFAIVDSQSNKRWIFPMAKNLEDGTTEDYTIELISSKKQAKAYAPKKNSLPYYNKNKIVLVPYGKDVSFLEAKARNQAFKYD